MADLKGETNNKSKLRLKTLPFFLSCSNSNSNDENKSAKKFGEEQGVVGLGIVAALNSSNEPQKNRVLSVSPRSKPIPIFRGSKEDELSEEYTCVISHVGSNLMKKKEYFDDGFKMSYWVSSNGVFCAPSPPVVAVVGAFTDADFLSCCYLCKKKLHGLDIFMYRGEKAFCSEECRYKQISVDEHKDKYARKQKQAESPCSSPSPGPMQFLAGMAAA